MAEFLQLALWNANGLTQHTEELKTFISIHNIHNTPGRLLMTSFRSDW
jgi:hypothetical protein